jgi:hypothetical protein
MKNAAVAGPTALRIPGTGNGSDQESERTPGENAADPSTEGPPIEREEEDDTNADVKSVRQAFAGFRADASAGRKGPRRVEAVWVTPESWQAFRRLAADPSDGTPAAQRELRKGLLQAKPHLEKTAGRGLLVFLVAYEKITWFGPILWDSAQVQQSISLRDPDTKQNY